MPASSSSLTAQLRRHLAGEVKDSPATLAAFSHDASIFEIAPQAVVFPKHVRDIEKLVSFVAEHKHDHPDLTLTPRSGGTDMGGGAINDSLIVSMHHLHHMDEIHKDAVWVEPGVYYRNFEKRTLRHGLLMPSYPASREICMMGGMVANNSGGEKSLSYGKVENYVTAVKMVLRDGKEHTFHPLSGASLRDKLRENSLEGDIYRRIYELCVQHDDLIKQSKPQVSKNSTGYNLWDVWDGTTFDLVKLIVGSQGTFGIVTKAQFRLVKVHPFSGLLVIYMPTLEHLGDIINTVIATHPTSFEAFDDHTMRFAIRYFPYFLKTMGLQRFVSLGLSLLPDAWRFVGGIPKLVLLVEYEGDSNEEIAAKIVQLRAQLAPFAVQLENAETVGKSRKFWTLRRESFNLLRHNVRGAHTAPFIDDFVVPPPNLPAFLPKLQTILERYGLLYTIAGHMGDGNFHIIPLMKLQNKEERAKIAPAAKEVNSLVLKYGGSLSGEHNDGMVRGPFLNQMYSPKMLKLFREVKHIFDPENIFNPHKKVDAHWDYSSQHIRRSF